MAFVPLPLPKLPLEVHHNVHKMTFLTKPNNRLMNLANKNSNVKVEDPFENPVLDPAFNLHYDYPESIKDILAPEQHYKGSAKVTKRPEVAHKDKFLAVIPYEDVTTLFDTLNKFTTPNKAKEMPSTGRGYKEPQRKVKVHKPKVKKMKNRFKKNQYKVKKEKNKFRKNKNRVKKTKNRVKKQKKVKKAKKKVEVCASSGTGVFAFFAFLVLNLNVMVDFMFSLMVDIMITGVFNGTSGEGLVIIVFL